MTYARPSAPKVFLRICLPILIGLSALGQFRLVFAQCKTPVTLGLLDSVTLIDDLAKLSSEQMNGRKTGTFGSALAQQFIQQRFGYIGLSNFNESPQFLHKFSYPKDSSSRHGVNLVGWLPGSQLKDEYIIVTAHYDHLGRKGRHVFWGADDNASGVAVLLAIAQKIATTSARHSVIFVATDAEEKGLYGAKAFVKNLPVARESVKLNINLDMLAEGGRKSRLYATYSRNKSYLNQVVKEITDIAGLCFIDGHRRSQRFNRFQSKTSWRKASDHDAFDSVGIPFLFIGAGVHNRYHTPKDSFENVNQQFYIAAAETAWLMFQAVDNYH